MSDRTHTRRLTLHSPVKLAGFDSLADSNGFWHSVLEQILCEQICAANMKSTYSVILVNGMELFVLKLCCLYWKPK